MEHFKFLGWNGLEIFGPKYQMAHHYAKIIWLNKSFGVCASRGVLTLMAARKKVPVRENADRKLESPL